MDNPAIEIRELINAVLKIPGSKIVTLLTGEDGPILFDIDKDGVIGYDPSHRKMFEARLSSAFSSSGGLIIRQFLTLKVERTTPSGEKIWIPRKNVYGVVISGGGWRGLTQSEIAQAHKTDAETGKPLPPEPDVSFQSFPIS